MPRRPNRRTLALFAVALLVIAVLVARQQGIEWSVDSLRAVVDGFGLWGPLVFILVVAFRLVFLVPSQVVLLAGGALFGWLEGTVYGALGVTLSAVIAFALARGLGGDSLAGRIPRGLGSVMTRARPSAVGLLVLIATGYPVGPISAFHFAAGVTRTGYAIFVPCVLVGAVLRALPYTYIGSSVVERGLLASWPAAVVLVVLLVPLLSASVRARIARFLFVPDESPVSALDQRRG